ncbi:hypothetical protein I5T79_10825 [Stenotrophomonas maltophilia]|nr:hypothetical protein [Stenotrophomonas maltophilia]
MIIASEDGLIEAILRRVLVDLNYDMDAVIAICAGGRSKLQAKIPALIRSASGGLPVIICTDLDSTPCIVRMKNDWFPQGVPRNIVFSVATREADAWILADPGISKYLASSTAVPSDPESVQDPKSSLIEIAKRSRKRDIKEEMIVAKGAVARVGPGYNVVLANFVEFEWNIEVASQKCKGLRRLLQRVSTLVA